MNLFLPEGHLIRKYSNQRDLSTRSGLHACKAEGRILEGRVIRCDKEHNLIVSCGPYTGVIPRAETALGLSEGKIPEIALLSLVGRPVCFTVEELSLRPDGTPSLTLSRRRAQTLAFEAIRTLPDGKVLPATVTRLAPFGAFLDVGCGLPSLLGIEAISVSRIFHPSDRLSRGQELFVLFRGVDSLTGRILVSHRELLGTWQENADRFSPGETVPGIVRSIKEYGVFVELTPNLSGLAEPASGLREGDWVSVCIKSILPEKHKVKLLIIDRIPDPPERPSLQYLLPVDGFVENWRYFPEGSEGASSPLMRSQ